MDNLLYKCMTKATNKEKGSPRHSSNWITSKRASFQIYDDHIECWKWNFNISEIENLIVYKTKQMFLKFDVIQFDYKGETFQFGFNPWAHPIDYIDINFTIEHSKVKYSVFSILLRLILIAFIIYYIIG